MPGEEDTGDAVLKEMGDDAGTQASAPERERAEQAAVDGDNDDHLPTLIGVCESEDDALNERSEGSVLCVGGELALEVAAEDGFLADAGGGGDEEIDSDFGRGLREQALNSLGVAGVQNETEEAEYDVGNDEKEDGQSDVEEDFAEV